MAGASRAEEIGALVVVESMWGNTRVVAHAVADGLSEQVPARVFDVTDAPAEVGGQISLLVVGGPTHAFSMSRATTRENAVSRGAHPVGATDIGIREWLDTIARIPAHVQAAAFDTKVRKPHVPGSAGHAATRRLRKKGARVSVPPKTFYVVNAEGPLEPGELERARAWGAQLGVMLRASTPLGR